MLTTEQIALLKTEITTDPAAVGYAAPWAAGEFGKILTLLNAQTVAATKADRLVVATDFVVAIVWAEYALLDQPKRDYLALLSRTNFVYKGDVKTAINAIFPATGAGTTRANLNKVVDRNSSRAEVVLTLPGVVVTLDDLAAVRSA